MRGSAYTVIILVISLIAISSVTVPLNGADLQHPLHSIGNTPSLSPNVEVTFSETGLSGQNWSVTLSGFTVNTTREEVSFFLPGGNYTYSIGSPPGFVPSVRNGSIHLTDQPIVIAVKFVMTSVFTFSENGLPGGDRWSVVVNGTAYSSTNSTITVDLPYGDYNYSVRTPAFYAAQNPTGRVGPGNETLSITIVHEPTEYIIIILVLVVADAAIVAALMRSRRKIRKSIGR